ncbi:MAG: histidinol dehydrogenase, partial [Bacteroidaceae bacterium]|nr:histidinol dehydrogenase [Bacteroidaceae bacterium]
MKIIRYPQTSEYADICRRPVIDLASLNETVATVLADIKARGDAAVKEYEKKFDKAELSTLLVSKEEIAAAMNEVSAELLDAIRLAHSNIAKFHESQKFEGKVVETCAGVKCWQKSIAIEKVGLYIP